MSGSALHRVVPALLVVAALLGSACADKEAAKRRHFDRAEALAAQGKYDEAILEYKNAVKLDTRYGEARFKLAEAYGHTNPKLAVREYVRAADLLPERADVQMKAAAVLLATFQFDLARKYADAAVKLDQNSVDARIVLANAMAGQKDVQGAVRELERVMQRAPGDARPYSTLGSINAVQGNTAQAEAAFKKAVETDPKSLTARVSLAYFYWSAQRPADAEAALKGALEIDRAYSDANMLLATLYLVQGRTAEAETPLLRLANQKDPLGTLSLADLYARTGRIEQARDLYSRLRTDPSGRSRAVARLAMLDAANGRKADAYRSLDAALKESPNEPEWLTTKAQMLANDGKVDDALVLARRAAEAAPDSGNALYTLGGVLAQKGDSKAAIDALNRALQIDPGFPGADAKLASVLLNTGDFGNALKHAQVAKLQDPKNLQVRLDLASAMLATKDVVGAETEIKSLAVDHAASVAVHSLYGRILLARSDNLGATREFDKALELNPTDDQALAGRLALDAGGKKIQEGRSRIERAMVQRPNDPTLLMLAAQFETAAANDAGAEKYYRKLLEKDPTSVEAYAALGQMYARNNRVQDARREYEEVVKRQPNSVPARTMIGMLLDSEKKYDESTKIYEAVVRSTAKAPVAANNLAFLYADRGEQLDVALSLAQSAVAQMPDHPDLNDTLGWVYYKKNLLPMAIKSLEFSVQKNPKNALYQYHLGMAYSKDGQRGKAQRALSEALKLDPAFPGADQARAALGTK